MGKIPVLQFVPSGGGIEWVLAGERPVEGSLTSQGGMKFPGFCDLNGYDMVMVEIEGTMTMAVKSGNVYIYITEDGGQGKPSVRSDQLEKRFRFRVCFRAFGTIRLQENSDLTDYLISGYITNTSPDSLYFFSSTNSPCAISAVERVYGGKYKI